ncbi:MAG: hypothetical protein KDA61_02035, partial [Planctomycetales bacterium]|nr:hypothetical protein [Planctomycetales bacterium]
MIMPSGVAARKAALKVGMWLVCLVAVGVSALDNLGAAPVMLPEPRPQSVATTKTVLPTVEQIQAQVAGLPERSDLPEEVRAPLGETLKRLLESLNKLNDTRSRRKKLEEQVAAVPRELATAKMELESVPPPPPQVAQSTPLDRVRSIKGEREAELAAAKALLGELHAKSENRKTRRVQATEMIASLRTELQKAESDPPPVDPEGKTDPRLLDAQRQEREAKLELLREKLTLQQQEQRTIEAEEELVPLQVNLAQRRVTRLEKEVALLTQAVSNRREIKVDEVLREHRELLAAEGTPLEESAVMDMAGTWTELVRKHGQVEREKTDAATREERLSKEKADTETAIASDLENNGSLRSGLGMKLLRQRERLPDAGELNASIRAVDQRIEEMGAFQAQLEVLADEVDGGVAGSRSQTAQQTPVVVRELAILSEIDRDVENYTTELIELKNHLENIQKRAQE